MLEAWVGFEKIILSLKNILSANVNFVRLYNIVSKYVHDIDTTLHSKAFDNGLE